MKANQQMKATEDNGTRTLTSKISGKYVSNNKDFSLDMNALINNDGSTSKSSYAKFIDGSDTYDLDIVKLLNATDEGTSEGDYKKPSAIIKGIERDKLDQVEKYTYNEKSFDKLTGVTGEKYYKVIKEGAVYTFQYKAENNMTPQLMVHY